MKNLVIAVLICILSSCFGIPNGHGPIPVSERQETEVTLSNTDSNIPKNLYKIVSPEEWQKSKTQKVLKSSPIDKHFIHLSTKEQLPHVAQKFWKNKNYVVLTLDTNKLVGRLVYEPNPGGTTLYYHLYEGKILLDAVIDASLVQNRS